MTKSHKDILGRAELPEQTLPMCLRTTLQQEFETATQRLADALKANEDADSLGGGPADVEAISQEIQDLREAMEADTIRLKFRALPQHRPPNDPGPTWDSFVTQHPPRDDDEEDAKFGFNRETFYATLARASLIEPGFDVDDWRQFRAVITRGQWELLTDVLWNLNQLRVMPVPFSPAASRILANSASASKRQPDSDSL